MQTLATTYRPGQYDLLNWSSASLQHHGAPSNTVASMASPGAVRSAVNSREICRNFEKFKISKTQV